MIRLIALDLDGTLLAPDFRVSETDAQAVIAARDRGVQIALNTARWYGLAQRTARRWAARRRPPEPSCLPAAAAGFRTYATSERSPRTSISLSSSAGTGLLNRKPCI